jgi:DNA-binding CsgD family transcriptional regulator
VTISNLFDLQAVKSVALGSALDGLACGVLLVDEHLGLVHANRAAEAMLSEGDTLQAAKGLITLSAELSQVALQRAVRQSADDESALGQYGIGIPAAGEGESAVIHVFPLARRRPRPGVTPQAVAALFVVPAKGLVGAPIDALTLLYDLTPAEARIFELVCAGKSIDSIADLLGIAKSTVKTHLGHVFEKTACKRQADLLSLAAGLSMPIRA